MHIIVHIILHIACCAYFTYFTYLFTYYSAYYLTYCTYTYLTYFIAYWHIFDILAYFAYFAYFAYLRIHTQISKILPKKSLDLDEHQKTKHPFIGDSMHYSIVHCWGMERYHFWDLNPVPQAYHRYALPTRAIVLLFVQIFLYMSPIGCVYSTYSAYSAYFAYSLHILHIHIDKSPASIFHHLLYLLLGPPSQNMHNMQNMHSMWIYW